MKLSTVLATVIAVSTVIVLVAFIILARYKAKQMAPEYSDMSAKTTLEPSEAVQLVGVHATGRNRHHL